MKQELKNINREQRIEAITEFYPGFPKVSNNRDNYPRIFKDACEKGYIEVVEHLLAIADVEFKKTNDSCSRKLGVQNGCK